MNVDFMLLIDEAINLEENAYSLYVGMAKVAEKNNLKRLLIKLSIEELKHRKMLELVKTSNNLAAAIEEVNNSSEFDYEINKQNLGVEFRNVDELKAAFRKAIEMEIQASNNYKSLSENTKRKDFKDLFNKLMAWELSHKVLLEEEFKKNFE